MNMGGSCVATLIGILQQQKTCLDETADVTCFKHHKPEATASGAFRGDVLLGFRAEFPHAADETTT